MSEPKTLEEAKDRIEHWSMEAIIYERMLKELLKAANDVLNMVDHSPIDTSGQWQWIQLGKVVTRTEALFDISAIDQP
jgi:hypothetical protein